MKSYPFKNSIILFKKIIATIIIYTFIFSFLSISSALANQNLRPIEISQGGNGTAGAIGRDLQMQKAKTLVREVAGTGIFKPTKTALIWAFKQMAAFYKNDAQRFNNAVEWLVNTDAITIHTMARESQATRAPPRGKLIIIYAGPGAGKSILTAHAIDRIPLKWLVVYTTRNARPGEKKGNPFYRYGMTAEEFDRFPNNKLLYIKSGTKERGYVVDVEASKKLMVEGNNLIIHSWKWPEFIDRSSAFEGTVPICLYVDKEATTKRLAYRLIKEEAAGLGLLPNGYKLPKTSSDVDLETVEKDLQKDAPGIYKDYLSRLEDIDKTQAKYNEIRSSIERKKRFKYLVDNSGFLAAAERDLMSILIADRYLSLTQDKRIFPEFFEQYVKRSEQLKNQLGQWSLKQPTATTTSVTTTKPTETITLKPAVLLVGPKAMKEQLEFLSGFEEIKGNIEIFTAADLNDAEAMRKQLGNRYIILRIFNCTDSDIQMTEAVLKLIGNVEIMKTKNPNEILAILQSM